MSAGLKPLREFAKFSPRNAHACVWLTLANNMVPSVSDSLFCRLRYAMHHTMEQNVSTYGGGEKLHRWVSIYSTAIFAFAGVILSRKAENHLIGILIILE